jgi:hypothetical protein
MSEGSGFAYIGLYPHMASSQLEPPTGKFAFLWPANVLIAMFSEVKTESMWFCLALRDSGYFEAIVRSWMVPATSSVFLP